MFFLLPAPRPLSFRSSAVSCAIPPLDPEPACFAETKELFIRLIPVAQPVDFSVASPSPYPQFFQELQSFFSTRTRGCRLSQIDLYFISQVFHQKQCMLPNHHLQLHALALWFSHLIDALIHVPLLSSDWHSGLSFICICRVLFRFFVYFLFHLYRLTFLFLAKHHTCCIRARADEKLKKQKTSMANS